MKIRFSIMYLLLPLWSFAMDWQQEYRNERETLAQDEILEMIERGNTLLATTDLVHSLSNGGSAFFPHAYIRRCGDQIAAVAQASLLAAQESGKDQILVLGVLHTLTDELTVARKKEMQDLDLTNEPLRGIFGPDLPNAHILDKEFSLEHFLFLLPRIAQAKNIPLPRVIVRYPNLVQGNVATLPGFEELKQLAADSIVVATADLCHHGAPYGTPVELRVPIGESALSFAQESIETCLDLLSTIDLSAYRRAAYAKKSDSVCVGQVMSALLGPLKGQIKDLKLIDYESTLSEYPGPTWVAASLVELYR